MIRGFLGRTRLIGGIVSYAPVATPLLDATMSKLWVNGPEAICRLSTTTTDAITVNLSEWRPDTSSAHADRPQHSVPRRWGLKQKQGGRKAIFSIGSISRRAREPRNSVEWPRHIERDARFGAGLEGSFSFGEASLLVLNLTSATGMKRKAAE